jgi:hypothetical protein
MEGFVKHGNKPSCSMNEARLFDKPSDYQLFK